MKVKCVSKIELNFYCFKKGNTLSNIEKEEYCNEWYTPRVLVDLFRYGVK